jgi:hypothetical protein
MRRNWNRHVLAVTLALTFAGASLSAFGRARATSSS